MATETSRTTLPDSLDELSEIMRDIRATCEAKIGERNPDDRLEPIYEKAKQAEAIIGRIRPLARRGPSGR